MGKEKMVKVNVNKEIIEINVNKLPIKDILSYSRIDCFKSCEYKYMLKYIKKNYTNDSSLALQIGSILHLGMEFKYQGKFTNDEIMKIVYRGYIEDDGKEILGIDKLKEEYPFEWEEKDKFGRVYDDKMKLYKERIYSEIDGDWECVACEKEFHILVDNKAIIKGFIDRIDKHKTTGEIRVVDYKSSKKEYEKKDLATPMQMYIYALACYEMFGQYPSEFVYDMILIGVEQKAMTKGWEKRGSIALIKKLDSLIYHINMNNEHLKPSATPLCYWCSYCVNNPNATDGRNLCEYYSLWSPDNKTFKTNSTWIAPSIEDDGWGDSWE